MGKHRNQERRTIATEMVDRFLRDQNRMSWALARHRTPQWCIQEYRKPILRQLMENHPELFKADDTEHIEKAILRAYHTHEVCDSVTISTRLTSSSPVPFGEDTGRIPHVARRADLVVPDETQRAMRILSDTPYRVDKDLWKQVFRPFLKQKGLERYNVCPQGIGQELDEITATDGDRYTTCDRCDEQTRVYPDFFYLTVKILRWLLLFVEEYPVNKTEYTKELNSHHGSDFSATVDKLSGKDFASNLLKFMLEQEGELSEILELAGAMWHYQHAMEHGTSAAMWEMDAIGSGPSHLCAEAAAKDKAWLVDLDRTSNARAENFIDPKSLLGRNMQYHAPALFRNVPFKEIRKLAGMIASPGTYGGGAPAFTGSFTGLSYDFEEGDFKLFDNDGQPIKFEVPSLLKPLVEGVTTPSVQISRIDKFSKLCVKAFAEAFPWIAPANEVARTEWEQGFEASGWPTPITIEGYTNVPLPVRDVQNRWHTVRDKVRPILRRPDGTSFMGDPRDLKATVHHLGSNGNGSPALAKKTHRRDAALMARVVIRAYEMGFPCFTVHDAFFVPWMLREVVNQLYVEEFQKMHGISLLAPNAQMLKH